MPDPGALPGEAPRDAVLITRPEPGASETAARVATLGLHPILSPVLTTRQLTPNFPPAVDIQAVLVTSSSALPALPETYHPLPFLAVGTATAARARAGGFAQAESADGDAQALAAYATRRLDPARGPLLLAVGRGNAADLADKLRQAGFRVLRRTVYAAEPVPRLSEQAAAAIREGSIRSALFFSAETARHFVRLAQSAGLAGQLADAEAVAISRLAAMALQVIPWRSIRVAARPTQDEMLTLLR